MIMQWAAKEGYEIPKDFGLMGFDDISVYNIFLQNLQRFRQMLRELHLLR